MKEVVPRPGKICDWLLNSSRDQFGFTPRRQVPRWPNHEVRGPKKTYFKTYWHGPMVFQWERQNSCSGKNKGRGPWRRIVVYVAVHLIALNWPLLLFTPRTMKSSQGHVKSGINCWTRPGTSLVLNQGNKYHSDPTMEFEVPKRRILRLAWSNVFHVGEPKELLR